VLRWMQQQGMTNYIQVSEVIRRYRRNPEDVLAMIKAAPAPAPGEGSVDRFPAEARYS
jgi:hypothetical protein